MKNQKEIALLKTLVRELESAAGRCKELTKENDMFSVGYRAGYAGGLKYAIDTVNYEIGIRLDPPNINYPGEIPTHKEN